MFEYVSRERKIAEELGFWFAFILTWPFRRFLLPRDDRGTD